MTDLLSPRAIIADAIMRQTCIVPSAATYAKTDRALANLADAGWAIVPREAAATILRAMVLIDCAEGRLPELRSFFEHDYAALKRLHRAMTAPADATGAAGAGR